MVQLSRISKLFLDRDQTTPEDTLARRQRHAVTLCCGPDVAHSYTLQLAVLTAANIASRCFPSAVKVALPPGLADAPLLLWPSLPKTFGQALAEPLGPSALVRANVRFRGKASFLGGGADRNSLACRSHASPLLDFLFRSRARHGHTLLPRCRASCCLSCSAPRRPLRIARPIAGLLP